MNFCTIFDSKYSYKGWVMIYSLKKFNPAAKIYVFCMDDQVYKEGKNYNLDNVVLIQLDDLQNEFKKIFDMRKGKKYNEFIVSLKPFLPNYIFNNFDENRIVFIDADILFFNHPELINDSMGDFSLYLYDLDLDKPRPSGPITSGFMGFQNDLNTHNFLKWWQDRCYEWCYWRAGSNKKFAEQGYLNVFYDSPKQFKNFYVCKEPGIHIGSWNIARHTINQVKNDLIIDNKYKLVCFHFHEFKLLDNSYYPTGWPLRKEHFNLIYEPYFSLIKLFLEKKLWEKI